MQDSPPPPPPHADHPDANPDPGTASLLAGIDPRRAAILGAAFETFCHYGFRRTSMEDIARAVGLSRPALYQHYQNKQDIYRSLIQHYFDVTETRVREALVPGMAPEAALAAVFAAKAGPELEAMFASAHGDELLDANVATSADLVEAGESRIADHLARWLATEAEARRIRLTEDPGALARTLIAAQAGLKSPRHGIGAYRAGAAQLARVIGRGLRA